jgi:hypothetical protein
MMHESEIESIQQAKGERNGALFGLFNALASMFSAARKQGRGVAALLDVFAACVQVVSAFKNVDHVRERAQAESTVPFHSM